MKNLYQHSIDLKKICIDNTDRDTFSRKLMNLPYRGYEVEELPDNRKIVITKPGGKNVYGTTQNPSDGSQSQNNVEQKYPPD